MKDRVSTKILNNGATRYGVYDETGKLLRYEYIKLEDEPSTEGDFFNKANMLPDHIPALLGLKMDNPQVKDALNVLANIGNLHVWERVQSGVTDYLTSTDRNAYPDQSTSGSDAYYTLGAAGYLNFYYSEYDGSVTWKYSSSISVDDDGTVSLVSPSSTSIMADNTGVSAANNLKGKFVLLSAASNYTDATHGVIYYIPADATISAQVSSTTPWYIQTNKAQPVTGHAAIPANTTITYLGQLGEPGAKIEVGSYVGTGTYGSSNPNSLTFEFVPKLVIIPVNSISGWPVVAINGATKVYWSDNSNYFATFNWNGNTVTWYGSSALYQLNNSGEEYEYIAIG